MSVKRTAEAKKSKTMKKIKRIDYYVCEEITDAKLEELNRLCLDGKSIEEVFSVTSARGVKNLARTFSLQLDAGELGRYEIWMFKKNISVKKRHKHGEFNRLNYAALFVAIRNNDKGDEHSEYVRTGGCDNIFSLNDSLVDDASRILYDLVTRDYDSLPASQKAD